MGVLVQLAEDILKHARIVERELENTGAPSPSLDADGPMSYPISPVELVESRMALVQASFDMVTLSRGPAEAFRSGLLNERSKLSILKVISYFRLQELVPAEGDVSFDDLAEKLQVDKDLLTRLLRFSMTLRIFKEPRPGYVAHTALSVAMRESRPLLELYTADICILPLLKLHKTLENSKRDGEMGSKLLASQYAFGEDTNWWELMKNKEHDSGGQAWFSEAMTSWSTSLAQLHYGILADALDWRSFTSGPVVDLGGGNGHIAIELATRFPSLEFIVQDLPPNESAFKAIVPPELVSRVTYQVQDAFNPQPEDLEPSAYFLKAVFHDWPDPACIKILQILASKMQKFGSKVIVMDRCLQEGKFPPYFEGVIRHSDIFMYSLFGAKERTLSEWDLMFETAHPRLRLEKVVQPPGSEFAVMQFAFI